MPSIKMLDGTTIEVPIEQLENFLLVNKGKIQKQKKKRNVRPSAADLLPCD